MLGVAMKNTVTTEIAYIVRSGHYDSNYSKVIIAKRTAKTIVVTHTDGAYPRTFTLRSTGEWLESGKTGYRSEWLDLDVVSVEKILADRAARRAFQAKAQEVSDLIEKTIKGERNGFGDYCGGEQGLARMELALSILRGEDDVH